MKKIIILIISLFSFTEVSATEKPTLYFFMSSTCAYCQMGLNTLNEIYDNYFENYEIVVFDISLSNNYDLYNYVISNYADNNYGVPLFVLGSEFVQVGYSDELENDIYLASLNEKYEDILIEMITDDMEDYEAYTLKEACENNDIEYIPTKTDEDSSVAFDDNTDLENNVDVQENEELAENEENNFNKYSLIVAFCLVIVFSVIVLKKK